MGRRRTVNPTVQEITYMAYLDYTFFKGYGLFMYMTDRVAFNNGIKLFMVKV